MKSVVHMCECGCKYISTYERGCSECRRSASATPVYDWSVVYPLTLLSTAVLGVWGWVLWVL